MIEFELPEKEAPGYLKRQRNLALFMDDSTPPAKRWEAMVEYLLDFVVVPEDKDAAREALWELSEEEYDGILGKINALGEVPKNK